MNEFLWQTYHRLIAELDVKYKRALYDELSLTHRLQGLVGPRGVGKTTLLLQYIKENLYANKQVFYFSADHTYFNEVSLVTYVDELYRKQNIRIFFIDEIHKYAQWNQELKNIYDAFPKIHIVFSGSSSMDLVAGSYDLSRRAKLMHLPGLSFREYLNIKFGLQFPAITFSQLLNEHQQIAANLSSVDEILQQFQQYLTSGYYPFVFQGEQYLHDAVNTIVDKTIYEDIANFYNIKTSSLNVFKCIINFLAAIPPGKVTINNMAQHLQIDNKTVQHYLEMLLRTGMVKALFPKAHGNQLLTKAEKIYLDNTTLLSSVNTLLSAELSIGTVRELAFLQATVGAGLAVFYPDKGDFIIDDMVFEVGGKNKTMQQLKNTSHKKILVKDDVLVGKNNEIPLYLWGFLY